MSNENLRQVCRDLGFAAVATVISSGNVVFQADSGDGLALEGKLEAAWPERLGFESTTIVRSDVDLRELIDLDPFGDLEHGRGTYLLSTFLKSPVRINAPLPWRPVDQAFEVVAATDREIFTVADNTGSRTPDVMSWLERQYGKALTSRTWLTVHRILKKMAVSPR